MAVSGRSQCQACDGRESGCWWFQQGCEGHIPPGLQPRPPPGHSHCRVLQGGPTSSPERTVPGVPHLSPDHLRIP